MDEEAVHAELVSALHGLQANEIRDNSPNVTKLIVVPLERLSDTACKLLGRYIANNTHLQELSTDLNIFQGLTKSDSIKELILESVVHNNTLIQSITPFLQNSPQLIKINFGSNRNIGSQGIESVVNALDGGSINDLSFDHCSITDISSLGNVTLPCIKKISLYNNNIQNIGDMSSYTTLESLNLDKNNIGIDGCQALAYLLQKEDSNLTTLNLNNNGIDDEGLEVLANSLKHNKKLNHLYLKKNISITEKGYLAILKLLVDVSSIENTYNNSNNTLKTLDFDMNPPIRSDERIVERMKALKWFIIVFTTLNKQQRHPRRFKVVYAQLISQHRKKLCDIQGIEYSYESIFSEIDPLILPEVLSFVALAQFRGKNSLLQTQTELFRMLVTVAPDLSSIVNRPAFFKERIEDNEAKVVALGIEHLKKIAAMNAKHECEVAALNAEKLEMKRELEALQSGEKTKDKEVQEDEKLSGKKRNRS